MSGGVNSLFRVKSFMNGWDEDTFIEVQGV